MAIYKFQLKKQDTDIVLLEENVEIPDEVLEGKTDDEKDEIAWKHHLDWQFKTIEMYWERIDRNKKHLRRLK